MKPLRIAVIDDDPSVRDGLAALLEAQGHAPFLFAGTEDFLAEDSAGYDCLLLDLWFREGGNGIDLLRHFLASGIATPVIMITRQGDVETAFEAGELGAVSYLPKPIRSLELAAALKKALARRVSPPAIAPDALRRKLDRLTPMERKVLDRLALDLPNKQIARDLEISVRTVETHRARVIEKLGTRSKIEMKEMLASVGELPE